MKNKTRITLSLSLMLGLGSLMPVSVQAAVPTEPSSSYTFNATDGHWEKKQDKWWYNYGDKTYPVNQWEKINNMWYHFDSNGFMEEGLFTQFGKTYYLKPGDGYMVRNYWLKDNGHWYRFEGDGVMLKSSWFNDGTNTYYLDAAGRMVTGWKQIGSNDYYFWKNGHLAKNTTVDGVVLTSTGAKRVTQTGTAPTSNKGCHIYDDNEPNKNKSCSSASSSSSSNPSSSSSSSSSNKTNTGNSGSSSSSNNSGSSSSSSYSDLLKQLEELDKILGLAGKELITKDPTDATYILEIDAKKIHKTSGCYSKNDVQSLSSFSKYYNLWYTQYDADTLMKYYGFTKCSKCFK